MVHFSQPTGLYGDARADLVLGETLPRSVRRAASSTVLQCSHNRRAGRCARIRLTDEGDVERRDAHVCQAGQGLRASLVCSVDWRTRWPVCAADRNFGGLEVADRRPSRYPGPTKERAQGFGEMSARLRIDVDLLMPATWISTGLRCRDVATSGLFSMFKRGIQRDRLTAAGRAGDQGSCRRAC